MWSAPSGVGCMATDFLPRSVPRAAPLASLRAVLPNPVWRRVSSRGAAPPHASVRVHIPDTACPPAGAAGRPGGTLPRRWRHTAEGMASPPSVGGSLPLYTIPRARIGSQGAPLEPTPHGRARRAGHAPQDGGWWRRSTLPATPAASVLASSRPAPMLLRRTGCRKCYAASPSTPRRAQLSCFADALVSERDIATVVRYVAKPLCVNMGFGIRTCATTPSSPRRDYRNSASPR